MLKTLAALLFLLPSLVFASPFSSQSAQDFWQSQVQPQGWLVHRTENHYIFIDSLEHFVGNDFYLIKTPPQNPLAQWLRRNTEVLYEQEGAFAIIQSRHLPHLTRIAEEAHKQGGFCGFVEKISPQPVHLNSQLTLAPIKPKLSQGDIKNQLEKLDVDNILAWMTQMESWETRHHETPSGLTTPHQLLNIYRSLTPSHRQDVRIDLVAHTGSEQSSLRVRIEGQSQPEEIIILGSHLDTIHPRNNKFAPGADDNASGTATNIEIFRGLMQQEFKPQRSIEIHAYAAEEIGLVGSQEMAEDYAAQNKKVQAMLQMDMNGYTQSDAAIHFISNGTDHRLTQDLITLAKKHLNVPVRSGRLFFGSSDHASWRRQGYPVAFPTENPRAFNRSIHTDKDTMRQINSPEQIHAFAQLGWLYLLHYAGQQDYRPAQI